MDTEAATEVLDLKQSLAKVEEQLREAEVIFDLSFLFIWKPVCISSIYFYLSAFISWYRETTKRRAEEVEIREEFTWETIETHERNQVRSHLTFSSIKFDDIDSECSDPPSLPLQWSLNLSIERGERKRVMMKRKKKREEIENEENRRFDYLIQLVHVIIFSSRKKKRTRMNCSRSFSRMSQVNLWSLITNPFFSLQVSSSHRSSPLLHERMNSVLLNYPNRKFYSHYPYIDTFLRNIQGKNNDISISGSGNNSTQNCTMKSRNWEICYWFSMISHRNKVQRWDIKDQFRKRRLDFR